MSVPTCIGIILDGNRRWAKREGLPIIEGHHRGYEHLIESARWARDRRIQHLVVYAFSTENWNRNPQEVSQLMELAKAAIIESAPRLAKDRIRILFVGDRDRVPEDVREEMRKAESIPIGAVDITLWICFSYGGRAEIAAAARAASEAGRIDEDSIAKYLWTEGMPDPEIIIRTGGRHRLSNFLLWQGAYSELFFLDCLWPEFSEADLDQVLAEFSLMQRNFGV